MDNIILTDFSMNHETITLPQEKFKYQEPDQEILLKDCEFRLHPSYISIRRNKEVHYPQYWTYSNKNISETHHLILMMEPDNNKMVIIFREIKDDIDSIPYFEGNYNYMYERGANKDNVLRQQCVNLLNSLYLYYLNNEATFPVKFKTYTSRFNILYNQLYRFASMEMLTTEDFIYKLKNVKFFRKLLPILDQKCDDIIKVIENDPTGKKKLPILSFFGCFGKLQELRDHPRLGKYFKDDDKVYLYKTILPVPHLAMYCKKCKQVNAGWKPTIKNGYEVCKRAFSNQFDEYHLDYIRKTSGFTKLEMDYNLKHENCLYNSKKAHCKHRRIIKTKLRTSTFPHARVFTMKFLLDVYNNKRAVYRAKTKNNGVPYTFREINKNILTIPMASASYLNDIFNTKEKWKLNIYLNDERFNRSLKYYNDKKALFFNKNGTALKIIENLELIKNEKVRKKAKWIFLKVAIENL
jgi:hypothetical protein